MFCCFPVDNHEDNNCLTLPSNLRVTVFFDDYVDEEAVETEDKKEFPASEVVTSNTNKFNKVVDEIMLQDIEFEEMKCKYGRMEGVAGDHLSLSPLGGGVMIKEFSDEEKYEDEKFDEAKDRDTCENEEMLLLVDEDDDGNKDEKVLTISNVNNVSVNNNNNDNHNDNDNDNDNNNHNTQKPLKIITNSKSKSRKNSTLLKSLSKLFSPSNKRSATKIESS